MRDGAEIVLIRHGRTAGNREGRYVGGHTDEPLCREGGSRLIALRRSGFYPPADICFVSPMIRCRETADLIWPGTEQVLIEEFREMYFGRFENRNYEELKKNPDYQKFIDSGGTAPFPGGENREDFRERCRAGFAAAWKMMEERNVARAGFAVHGGTIMSILSGFAVPAMDYFDAQAENGGGYLCGCTGSMQLTVLRRLDAADREDGVPDRENGADAGAGNDTADGGEIES